MDNYLVYSNLNYFWISLYNTHCALDCLNINVHKRTCTRKNNFLPLATYRSFHSYAKALKMIILCMPLKSLFI